MSTRRGAANGATNTSRGRTHEHIYAVVRRIPFGRVATYGQIATLAGFPRQPRLIGYALHALPRGTSVPWHRVINAQGRISPRAGEPAGSLTQRLLLETEGVAFDARGRISLERYGWRPRKAVRKNATGFPLSRE